VKYTILGRSLQIKGKPTGAREGSRPARKRNGGKRWSTQLVKGGSLVELETKTQGGNLRADGVIKHFYDRLG